VVHPDIPARSAAAVRDHGRLERRVDVLRRARDTGVAGRCGGWHRREAYQIVARFSSMVEESRRTIAESRKTPCAVSRHLENPATTRGLDHVRIHLARKVEGGVRVSGSNH
jgi:hypothetical protein